MTCSYSCLFAWLLLRKILLQIQLYVIVAIILAGWYCRIAIGSTHNVLASKLHSMMWRRLASSPVYYKPILDWQQQRAPSTLLTALFRGINSLPVYQQCYRVSSLLKQQAVFYCGTTRVSYSVPSSNIVDTVIQQANMSESIASILEPADTFTKELPGDSLLSDASEIFQDTSAKNTSINDANLTDKLMRTSRQVTH
jgi:hypothetical protein